MQFTLAIMLGAAGLAMAAPRHNVARAAGTSSCGLGNYPAATKGPIEDGISALKGDGQKEIKSSSNGECVVIFGSYGTAGKLCQNGPDVKTYRAAELAAAIDGIYNTCSATLQYAEDSDTAVQAMQLWQDDGSNILISGDSAFNG